MAEIKAMPFSFSNIGTTALILMVVYLSVAELIKYLRRNYAHSKK
jgi:hypothetical protein